MNNVFNATIDLTLNEIIYDFKIKNRLTAISKNLKQFTVMSDKELKKNFDDTRFQFRQKTLNVIFFDNVKVKLMYDKRHKSFLLKKRNKTYFKFHKKYKFSENQNRKLSNQRCGSFLIKRKIKRFVYELKLSSRWKIHSVISIAQLESANENDLYDKKRFHYFDFVKIKDDTKFEKSYEIEKIVDKRIRTYKKTAVTQYFIRWFEYDFEYDEWKNLAALADCMNLIYEYEKKVKIFKKKQKNESKKASQKTNQKQRRKTHQKWNFSKKKKKSFTKAADRQLKWMNELII